MAVEKILLIDDEDLILNFLSEALRAKNYDVTIAQSGRSGLALFQEQEFDLVITDMKMPDLTGIDILKKVKEISPSTDVIVITAFGSIENAVEAMRLGAFNYVIKPFTPESIEAVIDKANEHRSLVAETEYLRKEVHKGARDDELNVVGESSAIKKIMQDVIQVAKSNANVFISGESGTGKEVIAQAIHYHSLRNQQPYIRVNCAAVPDTLIESEFFGHEKGAFTGANAKRLGRFELANHGTLLLDEVTEIPLLLQSKLLRVIQEQIFERVGGTKPIHVDVRLVSTTNRDIKEALAEQVIREDLFYRLNVVPIHLPPLRERIEDIIPLVEHFMQKLSRENHRGIKELTTGAQDKLLHYSWPGNVRELANIIERAVVMNDSKKITPESLYLD